MNAEILRRAAILMRERAEAARASLSDNVPEWHAACGLMGDGKTREDAEHITSWHPAVALAVADWLNTAGADLWAHGIPDGCDTCGGCATCDDAPWAPHIRRALAVARAYLGEAADA